MALQVWLPLNGDLHNQGLNPIISTSTAYTIENAGKIGKCIKCTNANFNTGITAGNWDFTTTSISFGGWIKINKTELEARTTSTTYDSTNNSAGGTLMGYDSYGGLGLRWKTNNIYSTGSLSTVTLYVHIRNTSSGSVSTSAYTLPFDTWVHVLVVFNREKQTLGLYINGVLFNEKACSTTTYATSGNITQNTFLFNQASWDGGNGRSMSVPWQINDFRLYNHALSSKEVEEISKGLVLWYKLDNNGMGGDNLFTNSSLQSKVNNFPSVSSSYTQTFENNDGYNCFHIHSDNFGVGSSMGWNMASVINSYPIGTKFTVSGWVKTENITKGTTNYFCQFYYGGSYNNNGTSTWIGEGSRVVQNISSDAFTRSGTGWTYCYITSTFTRNDYTSMSFLYYLRDFKGDIYLRDFKFEVESQPTVWSPSPSDAIYPASYKTTIYDSSGYANSRTIVGALTAAAGSPKYSVATQFPGTVYINRPSSITSVQTVSIWAKWDSIPSGQSIIYVDQASKTGLGLMSSGILVNTNQTGNTFSKSSIVANTWYHFVIVSPNGSSNATRKFYVNGVEQTATSSTSSWTYSLNELQLGKRSTTSDGFAGKLVDFRMYVTALTDTQIAELYRDSMIIDGSGNILPREFV